MINPNNHDSMRPILMRRSEHSNQLVNYRSSTTLKRPMSAFDTPPSSSSHRQPHRLRSEELAMGSSYMVSVKVRNMPCRRPALWPLHNPIKRKSSNGHCNSHPTDMQETCTPCRGRKLRSSQQRPSTTKSRNIDNGRAPRLRHTRPHLESHKAPNNTTLRVKQARLARLHPNQWRSIYLPNIKQRATRNMDMQYRKHIRPP